jgi:hypothetical protein
MSVARRPVHTLGFDFLAWGHLGQGDKISSLPKKLLILFGRFSGFSLIVVPTTAECLVQRHCRLEALQFQFTDFVLHVGQRTLRV